MHSPVCEPQQPSPSFFITGASRAWIGLCLFDFGDGGSFKTLVEGHTLILAKLPFDGCD